MDKLEDFTKMFIANIRKEGAYYDIPFEDIRQEIALAYFSDSNIKKLFIEGQFKESYSAFRKLYRESIKAYSPTGTYINDSRTYKKMREVEFQNALEVVFKQELEEEAGEKRQHQLLEIKEALEKLDDEQLRFYVSFYVNGPRITSKDFGISKRTSYRKIEKLNLLIRGVVLNGDCKTCSRFKNKGYSIKKW